jgi:hypothetical protein
VVLLVLVQLVLVQLLVVLLVVCTMLGACHNTSRISCCAHSPRKPRR